MSERDNNSHSSTRRKKLTNEAKYEEHVRQIVALMVEDGWDYDEAMQFVKDDRE